VRAAEHPSVAGRRAVPSAAQCLPAALRALAELAKVPREAMSARGSAPFRAAAPLAAQQAVSLAWAALAGRRQAAVSGRARAPFFLALATALLVVLRAASPARA